MILFFTEVPKKCIQDKHGDARGENCQDKGNRFKK